MVVALFSRRANFGFASLDQNPNTTNLELWFASNEHRKHEARACLSRSHGDFAMNERTPPRIGTFFLLALACASLVLSCGDYGDLPLGGIAAPANGGAPAGGSGGSGAALPALDAPLPCEVLGSAGHECVSAHSSVRVLVPGYTGPLYRVTKDRETLDVGSVNGFADAGAHQGFCGPIGCTISIVYDQSGYGN